MHHPYAVAEERDFRKALGHRFYHARPFLVEIMPSEDAALAHLGPPRLDISLAALVLVIGIDEDEIEIAILHMPRRRHAVLAMDRHASRKMGVSDMFEACVKLIVISPLK